MSNDRTRSRISPHLGIVAFLIAATPILMALLPWDFGAEFTPYRAMMRGYSVAVLIVEIIVIFLALHAGFSLFKSWRDLPGLTRISLSLLTFFCVFSSVQFALEPARAFIGVVAFVIHLIFALAIFDLCKAVGQNDRRKFAFVVAAGVAVYCFVWAYSLLFFMPVESQWITHVPGVTNVRGLGFFAVAGFFATLAIFPSEQMALRTCLVKAGAIALGSIAVALAMWTGSRGAIVAIFVAVVWMSFYAKFQKRQIAIYAVATIVIAAAVSTVSPRPSPSYGFIRIAETIGLANPDPSAGRIAIWRATISEITKKPITGWGVDQFQNGVPRASKGLRQPHNVLLQILISVGFVGFGLIAMAILPLLRRFRIRTDDNFSLSATGLLIATAVFALYDAALYYNYPIMMAIIAAAAATVRPASAPATDRSNSPVQTGSDRATRPPY